MIRFADTLFIPSLIGIQGEPGVALLLNDKATTLGKQAFF